MGYIIIALLVLLFLVFLASFICFKICFLAVPEKSSEEFSLPPGEIYEPYRDVMIGWMREAREMPHADVEIVSFDGLKLRGKFYEYAEGAPIELMMHGYRGIGERDMCGGVQRAFALKRSALIIDQRACGTSEGRVISFGIKERKDCLSWIDFINKEYPNRKIILTGISMGASTVLMTAAENLPENVIAIQADCGYSSPKEIIKKVAAQMGFPPNLVYPFIRLGGMIFGRFDIEETTATHGAASTKLPILLLHGENDDYVPHYMSQINFDAAAGKKILFTVPGAGHGLSYLVDPEGYMDAFFRFDKIIFK